MLMAKLEVTRHGYSCSLPTAKFLHPAQPGGILRRGPRRQSAIMTVLLLGTLLFLGQLAWASLALQISAPAGCHHHAPQPAPSNYTHQCCAVGHNSALVVQHGAGSLTDI